MKLIASVVIGIRFGLSSLDTNVPLTKTHAEKTHVNVTDNAHI